MWFATENFVWLESGQETGQETITCVNVELVEDIESVGFYL